MRRPAGTSRRPSAQSTVPEKARFPREGTARRPAAIPGDIGRSLWAGTVIGRDHAEEFARAAEALELPHTVYLDARIAGTPEECVRRIQAFADLGVTEFIHYFTHDELRSVELFATQVIPAFR